MKKKIIFAIATGFFAVATMFNMNMLEGNSAGDVSLEGIAVMAKANNGRLTAPGPREEGGGGQANICDPIWNVTYAGSIGTDTKVEVHCTTGGKYICPICFWK